MNNAMTPSSINGATKPDTDLVRSLFHFLPGSAAGSSQMYRLIIVAIWLLLTACASNTRDEEIARAVEATLQSMPTTTPVSAATIVQRATETATPTLTQTPTEKPQLSLLLPTVTPTPLPRVFGDDIVPLNCAYDEFQDAEFCTKYVTSDIAAPIGITTLDGAVDVAVYVVNNGQDIYLRWDVIYLGPDWIFMDEITFVADGVRYQVPVNRLLEVKTDVYDGGSVAENFDAVASSLDVLLAIAFGNEVKARLSGSNRHFDKTLTWREIEIIRRALKTYEDLGGRFNPNDVAAIKSADYATPTPTFTAVPTAIPPHIISNRAGQYGMTTLDHTVNMGSTVKWNDCRDSEIQFRAVAATTLEFEKIGHYDKTPFAIDLHTQSGDLVGKVFEGERIEGYASSSVNLVPGVSDYLLKVSGYGCWHITMTARQ